MVIPNFARQALAEQPVTVFGSGTQQRCFCHVTDAVGALVGLMESEDHFGQVFNVGGTEEVSIQELAERVIERTGSRSEIVLVPYEEAYEEGFEDMQRRIPDLDEDRASAGLGTDAQPRRDARRCHRVPAGRRCRLTRRVADPSRRSALRGGCDARAASRHRHRLRTYRRWAGH